MLGYEEDVGGRSPEVVALGALADLGRAPPDMKVSLYALTAPLNDMIRILNVERTGRENCNRQVPI